MDDYLFREYTCSECGEKFSFSTQTMYQYKINSSNGMIYQCGYTCHNHALLAREDPDSYYPVSKYRDYVNRNERAMRGQGKTVLHPINTGRVDKE